MLLPFMADGIAMYRLVCKADIIAFVVDGITTGSYLSLSFMLFIRTPSHTCGRWYLPMFLFSDGLLTLMNIDSFISLERFCSSLPTILKLLMLVVWPVVLLWSCIGEGVFRCSLNLSPNVLAVSPIYSSSQSNLLHLNLYIMPLLLVMWSLCFGATSSSFRVLPLLKWTWMPYFLPMFFILSLKPSLYGTVMWLLYVVLLFLLFCLDFGASIFSFILFIAQLGYLHAVRAFCIFVCSSFSRCWLEQMFFALCKRVLMMLYLLVKGQQWAVHSAL